MMLVACQEPEDSTLRQLRNMNPSTHSQLYVQMLHTSMIHPDVVSLLTVILEKEKSYLCSLPLWEQRWMLNIMSLISGKENYRQPFFGIEIPLPMNNSNEGVTSSKKKGGNNTGDINTRRVIRNKRSKVLSITHTYVEDDNNSGKLIMNILL